MGPISKINPAEEIQCISDHLKLELHPLSVLFGSFHTILTNPYQHKLDKVSHVTA